MYTHSRKIRQGIKFSLLIILQFSLDKTVHLPIFAAIRRYHRRYLPLSLPLSWPLFAVIIGAIRRYLPLSLPLFAVIIAAIRRYLPAFAIIIAVIIVAICR